MSKPSPKYNIAVVGGGGHVGLTLSLLLAQNGFKVTAIHTNGERVERLKEGQFPFKEEGGPELLRKLSGSNLSFSTEHNVVKEADVIILTVGTPVDEHLNPHLQPVYDTIEQIKPYLHNGQV